MVKLEENLERSSRIFQVTLLLAECLARPDFLFAMESFLHFFFFFFPPPSLLPSFPFRYTNNICQSHLLRRANWNAKRDEKSCEWFPSNTCKKFLRFEEEDFTPLLRLVNFLLDELYFFFLSIFNFKQRRLE